MTDRELLKLAAKAAGVAGCFREKYPEDGYQGYSCGIGKLSQITKLWNPLTDDGDALRLKVKLGIVIDRSEVKPACWAYYDFRDAWYEAMVEHGDDAYAATRLAITMVAAEIGKEM